jgi:succinate-semialdehyde dehydrogenase / glutarate-semialdehyde dehydrogenase
MAALKVGNGLDEGIDVGPLVNADTRDKVAALVEDALARERSPASAESCRMVPASSTRRTVLFGVPDTADCVREEIFGPVAAVQTFVDEEDVIARANDTEYGLIAYVFTDDLKRGLQVSERLEYGMIGLNRGLVSDPGAPFGGVKQSRLGREGGHAGILEFMETQYISTSW